VACARSVSCFRTYVPISKDIRMASRYIQVSQTDLQQQYQLARQHVAVRHPCPPCRSRQPPSRTWRRVPAIPQALAATRHLMEMYRRQLTQPASRGTFDRLEHRLSKIIAALGQLPDPAMWARIGRSSWNLTRVG